MGFYPSLKFLNPPQLIFEISPNVLISDGKSSTSMVRSTFSAKALSITFSNWITLPGQLYRNNTSSVSGDTFITVFSRFVLNFSRKWLIRRQMSSLRSRSGGICILTSFMQLRKSWLTISRPAASSKFLLVAASKRTPAPGLLSLPPHAEYSPYMPG